MTWHVDIAYQMTCASTSTLCLPIHPTHLNLSSPIPPDRYPDTMAKDRTAEFHNTVLSIKSRTAAPANGPGGKRDEAKQSLLGNGQAGPSSSKGKGRDAGGGSGKSEFGRLAGGIAKDINATTLKLQKLAQREYPYP